MRERPAVDTPAVRGELERILADSRFVEARRISAFLRYVVEKSLAGQPDAIKESLIGIEVYGRGQKYDPQTDSIVRVEAGRLRAKLRDYYMTDGQNDPVRIELPKGSYVPEFRFLQTAAAVSAPAVYPPPGEPPPAVSTSPPPVVRPRRVVWGGLALAAVLAGAIYVFLARQDWRLIGSAVAGVRKVAVLPLADLSEKRDFEYFCEGLSEEIIDSLSRLPGVSVLARTSSFQFRGNPGDVRQIGARLGVDRLVSGSVRRSGARIRITTQLIDVATGYTVWSRSFDHDSRDVFAVQDEISRQVAGALRLQLATRDAGSATKNSEAYDLYLKGRYFYAKSTGEDERRAIQLFRQAAALDPNYAAPYAGLADALASLPLRGEPTAPEIVAEARAAADKALRLNPRLVEGLMARAHIARTLDYDWKEAERLYREAIQLNPGAARPHNSMGVLLSLAGRFDEAQSEFEAARKLDPLSMQVNTNLALNLYRMRRYADAVRQARETIAISPEYRNIYSPLAAALAYLGRYPEALAAIEELRSRSSGELTDNHMAVLGHIQFRAGLRAQALATLKELETRAKTRYVPHAALADLYLTLGNNEKALDFMERGLQSREILLAGLLVSPHADPVRSNPRFQSLVARIAKR